MNVDEWDEKIRLVNEWFVLYKCSAFEKNWNVC